MNNFIKMLIDRLKSKSPKLFAILRNVALILIAALGAFQMTEWGSCIGVELYTLLYSIFGAIAGTAQLTTTKRSLMEKDKGHQKEGVL